MTPDRTLFLADARFDSQAAALAWGADPYALGAHMSRCRQARSPWFSLHCAARTVREFVEMRSFTTLVLVAIVARVVSLTV